MATLTADEVRDRVSRGGEPLDESAYSDEWIDGVVAEHDARFARYRGDIPDSAEVVESLRPVGGAERLVLRWPKATVVDSVTVDGTALADDYWELRDGMLCGIDYTWPRRLLVVVTYTHGWDSPDDLKRSCAMFVEKTAVVGRVGGAREVRAAGPDFSSPLLPNATKGAPTGWSEVDGIWNSYPDLRLPGVA